MLSVDRVSVRFGQRTVLNQVSLDVAEHEVVALLGASGSGKSTLLRIIAGLLPADSGRVMVDGRDVTDEPTHLRQVGMVFQDEQLFPHLDVAGNIAFGLRMVGVARPDRERRVEQLLELVGMPGMARRAVQRLSGGEAKRVALARSMATRPKVLLLDEPLTGLDRALHDRLVADLGDLLRADRAAVVLVTHDIDEAAAIADRVLRIEDLSPAG